MKTYTEKQQEKPEVYEYVGTGVGIPGLPHKITKQEAEQRGILSILLDAIENGSYIPQIGGD
jgi:16S rRNA G527 N7-methylase RsmG